MVKQIDLMQKAREFLDKKGFQDIKLEETDDDSKFGSYRYGHSKTISLNLTKIIEEANERNISPIDAMLLTLCHEIGHCVDDLKANRIEKYQDALTELDVKGHRHRIEDILYFNGIMTELIAWTNGEKYIPKRLLHAYKCSNIQSMSSYIQQFMDMMVETKCKDYKEVMARKSFLTNRIHDNGIGLYNKHAKLLEDSFEMNIPLSHHFRDCKCPEHKEQISKVLDEVKEEREEYSKNLLDAYVDYGMTDIFSEDVQQANKSNGDSDDEEKE